MRKLFTLCLLVFSLSASAQWQQTGSKVRYVNGLGIPTKDTAAGVAADSSQIVIRPQDSALYVKYKRTWLRVGGGGGSIAGSGTTNYIPKFTSSNAIGNSQIFDNGTNVGVGTTSPLGRLHVAEAASGGVPTIQVQSTTTQGGQVWFRNGSTSSTGFIVGLLGNTSGDGVIYHEDAKNITFYTTATERMRITSGGDVGIGTASPIGKLNISSASGDQIRIDRTSQTARGIVISGTDQFSFGTWTSPTQLNLTTGGNLLLNTTTDNGTDRLQVSGSVNVSTLATTNNLSVTTNATVGGTLRVTGSTTLGTTTTGAITASSIDAASGNGTFGNIYSNGLVQMLGVNVKYRNISATYTATTSDDYFINITSGTFTLNLPTAATPFGQVYVIKNSGTGTITVDPNGTQTIDGATTFTMNVQNQSITIIGDGSNWKIVSKYL